MLTLDLDVDGIMPSDWGNAFDGKLWHDLLLSFVGVKKLSIDPSLTFKLPQAPESLAGGLTLELLPWSQALEVPQYSSTTTRERPCNKVRFHVLENSRIRGSPRTATDSRC